MTIGRIDPPRSDLTSFGIYLRAYSLYLDGERRREERVSEMRDPLERSSARNANLPILEAELRGMCARGDLDAFGMYVYGAVLRGTRGTGVGPPLPPAKDARGGGGKESGGGGGDAAHRILVRSILLYPFNWSAWLDLGELCVNDTSIDEEVEDMLRPISDHWMYHFFCVHVFIENKANENAIVVIEKLANGNEIGQSPSTTSSGFFVQSAYLQSQLAMAYYDARDYDSAHEHFLALSEREPYRLDQMDAFSNVLYVKDQKVALSHLAHRSMTVDKYRPETCIVVGNYYSSRARHEKAVQYFQRALKVDRTYLSAWTLLGHEYIEMKNTAAAIEAYRRAVDISDREYRAWYGLGQTYEIMNMLLHALFYFRKAASLHPHDARMWCAIGGCLLGLDRRADAERSYERAVSLGDGEGIATRKLAELYREDGDEERAAKCYLRHLELRYQSQLPGAFSGASADSSPEAFETVVTNVRVDEPEAEALLYLAYYYRDNLEYDQAIVCATRLEDYPGPEKDQGRSLLRDIRSRMDQQVGDMVQVRSYPESAPTPALGMKSRRSLAPSESSFEFSP
jgi:anaphase-promoting complex subunit 8